MDFRLTQNFDAFGTPEGFSITIKGLVHEIEIEDLEVQLDNLEILRNGLLTTSFTTSATYQNVRNELHTKQAQLKAVTNALVEARKQYESLQAFLFAQGIKELPNFP